MTRNLLIVEFKEEAQYFLRHHAVLFDGETRIISLLPESSAFFDEAGIKYETSIPYFPKSSHEQCLKRVYEVIAKINEVVKIQDTYGLKNAYGNALTFYLRPYLSYVVSTIELINNILQVYPATKLHVCGYLDNDCTGFGLTAKERILGELAGLFRDHLEVCLYVLKIPKSCKPDHRKKFFKAFVSSVMFSLELLRLKKFRKHPFVFYSLRYYFDRIARDFKENDLYNVAPGVKSYMQWIDFSAGVDLRNIHLSDAIGPNDQVFGKSWHAADEELKIAHHRRQLLIYRGYDFSSVIFKKMTHGYGPELKKLNRQAGLLKKFYKKLKPAVVLSHVARDFSYVLGELAELMGIPSVLISHGSHVPPKNEYDRMEWYDHGKGLIHTDYRYHLLQSPWAVEHVRAMGYRGPYYPIEPLIFPSVDRIDKQKVQLEKFPQSEGKCIVMHAGTPKPRGSNRLYIYETLDEYIAYMSDLVEAAREIPEIFLVIRFRPYPYLSTEHLKALLPKGNHYAVATDGQFSDYLKIADIMVSFSSTTIEEALINSIPVLQYDPSNRYVHIEGARWQDKAFAHADSVYYIGDRDALVPGLKWIVDNHLNATLVGDFFERHVFKSGEALSVQEFIERMLNGNLPKPIDLKEKKHLEGMEIF